MSLAALLGPAIAQSLGQNLHPDNSATGSADPMPAMSNVATGQTPMTGTPSDMGNFGALFGLLKSMAPGQTEQPSPGNTGNDMASNLQGIRARDQGINVPSAPSPSATDPQTQGAPGASPSDILGLLNPPTSSQGKMQIGTDADARIPQRSFQDAPLVSPNEDVTSAPGAQNPATTGEPTPLTAADHLQAAADLRVKAAQMATKGPGTVPLAVMGILTALAGRYAAPQLAEGLIQGWTSQRQNQQQVLEQQAQGHEQQAQSLMASAKLQQDWKEKFLASQTGLSEHQIDAAAVKYRADAMLSGVQYRSDAQTQGKAIVGALNMATKGTPQEVQIALETLQQMPGFENVTQEQVERAASQATPDMIKAVATGDLDAAKGLFYKSAGKLKDTQSQDITATQGSRIAKNIGQANQANAAAGLSTARATQINDPDSPLNKKLIAEAKRQNATAEGKIGPGTRTAGEGSSKLFGIQSSNWRALLRDKTGRMAALQAQLKPDKVAIDKLQTEINTVTGYLQNPPTVSGASGGGAANAPAGWTVSGGN